MARRLVLVIVVLAVSACGGGDADPLGLPSRQPDVTGEVRDRDADGRILVVPDGDACGYWVAVGDATVVDVDVQIEPEAIERGWRARVWIDGPVAESCPAQTSAEAVEILPR
jgi:hypothetical protein